MEEVVLVNNNGDKIGLMEKIQAHKLGLLHLAVSVYLFNSQNNILLQKRASNKYHCGGLWSNTCCTHPREGETPYNAAIRRVNEELGIETDNMIQVAKLTYNLPVNNDLVEHEYDFVYISFSDEIPILNLDEVEGYEYLSIKEIDSLLQSNEELFTPWFKYSFPLVSHVLQQSLSSKTNGKRALL